MHKLQLTLLAVLMTVGLAPAASALPTVLPEPLDAFYADAQDAAFDAVGAGNQAAFDAAGAGQGFAFGTGAAANEAAFGFAGQVHTDAFGAAQNLQTDAIALAGDAHGYGFGSADQAHDLTFQTAADVHGAGFGFAGQATDMGFGVAGDAHATGFDAADAARSAGFNTLGDLQEGGLEGYETVRRLSNGALPSTPNLPASHGVAVAAAGQGHGRRPTPAGMENPYESSYFSNNCANTQYRVVAFQSQDSSSQMEPFQSGCTTIGVPALLSERSPSAAIRDHLECAAQGNVGCFWFGADPDLSQVRFDVYNNGGSKGHFYLVRLLVAGVSIDFEVLPDAYLPAHTSGQLGTGSDAVAVAAVLGQLSVQDIDITITTEVTSAIFVVHANLGSGPNVQGYDVQFGQIWDGQRMQGASSTGPYVANIDTEVDSSGTDVIIHLEQNSGNQGAHVVFGAGSGMVQRATTTVDITRPPGILDLDLRFEPQLFGIESAVSDQPMDFVFLGDVLGGGEVDVRELASLQGLEVRHASGLSSYDDGCDPAMVEAYDQHNNWYPTLSQTCIRLESISPNARVTYLADGLGVNVDGLETAGNLELVLGPDATIAFRALDGGSITATVQNLVVNDLTIDEIVAEGLTSFWYAGGDEGNQGRPTLDLHATLTPSSYFRLALDAPDFDLGATFQGLESIDVEGRRSEDPLRVRLAGTAVLATGLTFGATFGIADISLPVGHAQLVRSLEVVLRDRSDMCDSWGEWNCWPAIGITADLAKGGSIVLDGHVRLWGFWDDDVGLSIDRDANGAGKYHTKVETPCGQTTETTPPDGSDRLRPCNIAIAELYASANA